MVRILKGAASIASDAVSKAVSAELESLVDKGFSSIDELFASIQAAYGAVQMNKNGGEILVKALLGLSAIAAAAAVIIQLSLANKSENKS